MVRGQGKDEADVAFISGSTVVGCLVVIWMRDSDNVLPRPIRILRCMRRPPCQ